MIQEITRPDTTTPTTSDRPVYRVAIPEVFGHAERELVFPAPHTADEIATVIHAELVSVGYDGRTIDVQVQLSTGAVHIVWDGALLVGTLAGPGVGDRRAAFIAGLRELADFYEANPAMPVDGYPKLLVGCCGIVDGDEPAAQLVRHAAGLLGVEATESRSGGWDAVRQFGALKLDAYSTTRERMARWDAEQSYRGVVEPEAAPAAEGGVSR